MKKTILFMLAILLATTMMAQNRATLFSESFDGNAMPAGWSVAGVGQTNWHITNSSNAGGSPNEALLYWDPRFNGTTRLVTPAIDLTGRSSVVVGFKHALNNYSGSHPLSIATSSDDGATWNVGWTHNYGSSSRWEVFTEITTADMDHDNVKFCITFTGDSYNINYWYFDDFAIYAIEEVDGRMLSVNVPEVSFGQETGELATEVSVGMTMMNFGRTQITSVEATYEIAGFEPVTQVFNTTINSLATKTFNFTEKKTLLPGAYDLTITINKVNGIVDDDLSNNTMQRVFYVSMASEEKIPMIEHFSSSTCGPCVSVNNTMNTFCNNNAGRFTYTKYQMNWPAPGDPYYTEEGGVRRGYYEVSGVPSMFLDGTSSSVSQSNFDQQAAKPACFDVTGSFSVDGNVIHILADVAPYVDIPARVYVSVNEKVTHNNVGSNGETTFHHIFMKMLPDGEGSSINFVAGETQHFEFTQNMSGTHVEEMSDLEVSIWVQNYATKEVYNSRFAYEYTDVHPYTVENLRLVQDPDADCYCFNASWDAPEQGNPIGYNVYVNNELVAENTTDNVYSFVGEADRYYVVGVVALYEDGKTSVKSISSVLHDEGLLPVGATDVVLDLDDAFAEVVVTNGNIGSENPIVINSIEETNLAGEQYLVITLPEELPYTLNYGEDFAFQIEPNYTPLGKSVANTIVKVESDAGTVQFLVKIDGELLSVTQLSSTPKLYPNPANTNVRIDAETGIENVMVYNVLGSLVEKITVNGNTIDVNLSQYSNGVYFFNIRQSDGTISNQRVVVNH